MELLQHDPTVLAHKVEPRPGKVIEVDPEAPRAFEHYFAPDSSRWWRNGVKPRRDSFRQRSYDAEAAFLSKTEHRTFSNIAEVARFIRDVMEKPFFQRRFPYFKTCQVEYKPGTRSCSGGPRAYNKKPTPFPLPADVEVTSGHITMSTFGMTNWGEVTALHELAHAVLPGGHRHDRRWARTFIEFIGCAMGFDCKKVLMEEFRLRRIPFSPVRKPSSNGQHLKGVKRGTVSI